MTMKELKIGNSIDDAIPIHVTNEVEGISAEYQYIALIFGVRNKDWKTLHQDLMTKFGHHYDRITILLKDGTEKDIYFDITEFFGK